MHRCRYQAFGTAILSLILGASVACKATSFDGGDSDGDKSGSSGRPTEEDEAVPGYLLNVYDARVQFGPDTTRITAMPGSVKLVLPGAILAFWEFTDSSFDGMVYLSATSLLVPASRLVVVKPEVDGSFDVTIPHHANTRQVLAGNGTDAGFIVYKTAEVTAAEIQSVNFIGLDFDTIRVIGEQGLGTKTMTGTGLATATSEQSGTSTGTGP